MSMKIMIVVTHLLGTGHLSRALTLGHSFAQAGHDVRVVSGGMPAPQLGSAGVRLIQLPPVRSDGVDFTRLLGPNDQIASPEHLAQRSACLTGEVMSDPPDALITELFPFGRRILRDEFKALLSAARSVPRTPKILCSIRDILAPPSKASKAAFAEDVVAEFYDAVLVHSDAATTPLENSWPVSDILRPYLRYTGFVAPPSPRAGPDTTGQGEIIVSAGGGSVGRALFEAAIKAASLSNADPWRILVGGQNTQSDIAELAADAPSHVHIEAARPDFRTLLMRAKASVSMCGYNTALDVLQTGVPAVFIPFDEGGEVEQGLRATALATQPTIAHLTAHSVTPHSLLSALDLVTSAPRRHVPDTGFNGAQQTVKMVEHLVDQA
jgi:predicted glycosyltransferase